MKNAWGSLQRVFQDGSISPDTILLTNKQFIIGRGAQCEYVIKNNTFVSNNHCNLICDPENNVIPSVIDMSTNGVLLNWQKVEKNVKNPIKTDDIIHIVNKGKSHELNISFRYTYLIDTTADTSTATAINHITPTKISTPAECSTITKSPPSDIDASTTVSPIQPTAANINNAAAIKPILKSTIETKQRAILMKALNESDMSDVKTNTGDTESKIETPSPTASNNNSNCENNISSTAIDKSSDETEAKECEVHSKPASITPALLKSDSLDEMLCCGVCQDIMHNAICLQPCLHNYCAGCYSEWMDISQECPACRARVDRISKNHFINKLVESVLQSNPGRKRSELELNELDKKNKITNDMLYPKKKRMRYDSDYEDYHSPSDAEEIIETPLTLSSCPPYSLFPHSSFLPTTFFKCRQCPGYFGSPPIGKFGFIPSYPPKFTCSAMVPIHITCQCCYMPMPDRRTSTDLSVPPQQCDVCKLFYCHMYWGCWGIACKGCLSEFKNVNFEEAVLDDIVNKNRFESDILKQFLKDKALTIKEMLQVCMEKLDSKDYTCTDSRTFLINSKSRVCYSCALKNFRDLAYLYRRDIPQTDMRKEHATREDCHWGRDCTTQYHKLIHSSKYNHVCERVKL